MRRIADAALDAALAGIVVGLADLAVIVPRAPFEGGDVPGTAAIVLGLTALAVTVVGIPAILALRLIGRHPLGAPLIARLREAGAPRVEALAAIAVAFVALAVVWFAGYKIVVVAHKKYRLASGAGLLSTSEIAAVMIVVGILATAVGPRVTRWLGRRGLLQRMTSGRAGLALGLGLAVAFVVAVDLVIARIAPAFDRQPAYVLALVPVALIVAAAWGPAAQLRLPARAITGGALAVLAIVAVAAVGSADRARGAVIGHGTSSELALRELYALTDGDDDGFSDAFGGGDCDDDDARVYPGAPELAGNGKDDNCAGGDATTDGLAHRMQAQPSATPGAPHHDIILVTIDSVRADHCSTFGYARDTTPVLTALAARGARFDRAISPAPMTRWAVPALLFGRYTSTLPYREPLGGDPQLREHRLATLASTLRDAGYATHAVISNKNILGAPTFAGFDGYEEVSPRAVPDHTDNADDVANRGVTWLEAQPADQPAFLWLHFIDPHYPYAPRPEAPRFGKKDDYDREIAFTDAELGRMLDRVRALRGDDVIVVVTADHGEAFGEHGTRFHGKSLYEEVVHVPLVIAAPGAPPTVITAPISLVDLAPTLLDLVGLTTPAGMNGWSAAAAIRGTGPMPEHDVLGQLFRGRKVPRNLVALFGERHVVIRDLDTSTVELYDLVDDPDQLHDLGDSALARDLAQALAGAEDRELSALPGEETP